MGKILRLRILTRDEINHIRKYHAVEPTWHKKTKPPEIYSVNNHRSPVDKAYWKALFMYQVGAGVSPVKLADTYHLSYKVVNEWLLEGLKQFNEEIETASAVVELIKDVRGDFLTDFMDTLIKTASDFAVRFAKMDQDVLRALENCLRIVDGRLVAVETTVYYTYDKKTQEYIPKGKKEVISPTATIGLSNAYNNYRTDKIKEIIAFSLQNYTLLEKKTEVSFQQFVQNKLVVNNSNERVLENDSVEAELCEIAKNELNKDLHESFSLREQYNQLLERINKKDISNGAV